jgi:hypothetical protein
MLLAAVWLTVLGAEPNERNTNTGHGALKLGVLQGAPVDQTSHSRDIPPGGPGEQGAKDDEGDEGSRG